MPTIEQETDEIDALQACNIIHNNSPYSAVAFLVWNGQLMLIGLGGFGLAILLYLTLGEFTWLVKLCVWAGSVVSLAACHPMYSSFVYQAIAGVKDELLSNRSSKKAYKKQLKGFYENY